MFEPNIRIKAKPRSNISKQFEVVDFGSQS